MGFGKTLRQRVSIIRYLVEFQKTVWYPILFSALCIISGTHGYRVYLPIMWVLCAFVLFSVLFTDDNKVFITPLFMIYLAVGFDNEPSSFAMSNGDMLASFDPGAFKHLIICAAVTIGAFLIRMVADGSVADAFKKRRGLTLSILALDVSFLLNGAFSARYNIKNLMCGAIIAFGLTVVYFTVHGMLEKSKDVVTYACKVAVCTSYTILLQVMLITLRHYFNHTLFFSWGNAIINRNNFNLGWGVTTVVGAMLVLGIPAAFYLAKNCKFSGFSYISAIFFAVGTFLVDARSAIIVGLAALVVGIVICCIKGRNCAACRIYLVILVLIPIAFGIYLLKHPEMVADKIEHILKSVFGSHSGDSGRIALWKNGISDFLSAPVFGVGFSDGGYVTSPDLNVYSNMYHCIGIEFLGATGILGCLAFLFHIAQLLMMFFKKFRLDKFLIMMVPAMIIGMSLVDNFFFYFNFQIFYGAFLVIAEISAEEETVTG